jgi:hypothetical protein
MENYKLQFVRHPSDSGAIAPVAKRIGLDPAVGVAYWSASPSEQTHQNQKTRSAGHQSIPAKIGSTHTGYTQRKKPMERKTALLSTFTVMYLDQSLHLKPGLID